MKLKDRRAVITGASQGLGRVIAESFLREGARVLACARDRAELERTRDEFEKIAPGQIFTQVCDVAHEPDLDALAAYAASTLGGVDILVANAGIYGPKGRIEDVAWAQWVQAVQINLFGAVYSCRACLPLLKKSPNANILIISGGGATKPLPFLSAYAASKAGVVRFGETLAQELKPLRIDVNMIAPGALNTRLLAEILEAGPEQVGEQFYRDAVRQKESGGSPLTLGAELCVFLASGAAAGITGRLWSAPWDPWQRVEEFRHELEESDIYTLRRILPADRGKNWDRE